MLLQAIETSEGQGQISGTGTFLLEGSPILGAVNVSADGTNSAVVTVKENDVDGDIIFDQSTKSPLFVAAPFKGVERCYFSVSGVNATCQFFQWVE